jgi:hypothetical protein
MADGLILIQPRLIPPLDPDFCPAVLMIASLFRGISKERFGEIKDLFLRI